MSNQPLGSRLWAAGICVIGYSGLVGYSLASQNPRGIAVEEGQKSQEAQNRPVRTRSVPIIPLKTAENTQPASVKTASVKAAAMFSPPADADIPDNGFGEMVRLGAAIFHDTQKNAGAFVGNDLQCSNCHIDNGRLAGSAPLWAAYVSYPAYRSKNGHVNTFSERLQGCFKYSMNGKSPPLGDKVLIALESYAY